MPPNTGPNYLIMSSYNTTSTSGVFQWDPVYFSNGPVTGYRFYIGDVDGIFLQGSSNTTIEINVRSDVETINASAVAINSAGEGIPTNQVIHLNGRVITIGYTCVCMGVMLVILAAPGRPRAFLFNVSSIRIFWDPPSLFIVDFMHYLLRYVILNFTWLATHNYIFVTVYF